MLQLLVSELMCLGLCDESSLARCTRCFFGNHCVVPFRLLVILTTLKALAAQKLKISGHSEVETHSEAHLHHSYSNLRRLLLIV